MKKATIKTIADKLGISKNSVAKALHGLPGVSDKLRSKVNALADELGYTVKTEKYPEPVSISVVCHRIITDERYFWPIVLSGIWECASENNVSLQSIIVEENGGSYPGLFQKVAMSSGIIVIGDVPDNLLSTIKSFNIPFIAVDYYTPLVDCDYVNSANETGIFKAVDYLAKHNHQKIGYVNNSFSTYSYTKRNESFKSSMASLGLPVDERFVWTDTKFNDLEYYRKKMPLLESGEDRPTAWICGNDSTAGDFYCVLIEHGFKIPDDFSIIGFDNNSLFYTQFLTTMAIPQKSMGRYAVSRLMHRIQNPGEPYANILFNTDMVVRNSVKMLELI